MQWVCTIFLSISPIYRFSKTFFLFRHQSRVHKVLLTKQDLLATGLSTIDLNWQLYKVTPWILCINLNRIGANKWHQHETEENKQVLVLIDLHNRYNRATPEKFLLYKHAISLFKLMNDPTFTTEWVALNFNQIFTSRQTRFLSTRA